MPLRAMAACQVHMLLKIVNPTLKTPVAAVWVSAVLAVAATLYAAAFSVLAVGCAVFLYISYIMPTAAGILAEGKTWKHKGPFDLGGMSKVSCYISCNWWWLLSSCWHTTT